MKITRSRIREWLRGNDGGLTPERRDAIDAAYKAGRIIDDLRSQAEVSEPEPVGPKVPTQAELDARYEGARAVFRALRGEEP